MFMFRVPNLAIAIGGLAVTLILPALSAHATEIPQRKPGHWQLTTVTPGVGRRVFDVCVAEEDNIAVPENAGDCGEPEVMPAGSETIVNVTCKVKDAKQVISTAFSGDYKTNYHAVVKISFDPPMGGQDRFGITIDGKYIGPDCDAVETDKP